jgi:hypothetical protein
MKVKMLQTRRASLYGGATEEFAKGGTYDLPTKLATAFLTEGVALRVRERVPEPQSVAGAAAEPQPQRRKR